MNAVSTRGMGAAKVTHVRQALEQICADAYNPRTMTAQIMGEHGVTVRDVLNVCDVARDVVFARRASVDRHDARQEPPAEAPSAEPDEGLRSRIASLRAVALGEASDGA